jgi:PTH1 family peptidyl-tRNA hydrolase
VQPPTYCVAGLGNPGERYTLTRHNVGFRVADRLARDRSTDIRRLEFQALTAIVEIDRSEVLLMKPQTYMNRSGESVAAACRETGLDPGRLIVVYDDVDLPLGRIRVRRGGGAGGHRGVRSVIEETGESAFARVRIGVGRPPAGMAVEQYVLEPFAPQEEPVVEAAIERAAGAVRAIVNDGIEAAMQRFNAAASGEAPTTENDG